MIKKIILAINLFLIPLSAMADAVYVPDSADQIKYDNEDYPNVGAALDHLLYVTPDVSGFTNNRNNVEIGTTITSTVLNWSLNKTMTSSSLNQGIGSITPSLTTYTDNSSYSTNRTYTITVGDGTNTDQASTSVNFLNKRYWGVSSNTSLNDAQIIALSSELSSSKTKSFTSSPSAQYIYFVYPASLGSSTFTVNGLSNDDWTLTTQNHTNASGNTTSYNVYRTNNLLTGTYIVGAN